MICGPASFSDARAGGEAGVGRLEGKVAIVTGSARGQGEAHVRAFVTEGARVVVSDIDDDTAEFVAKSLGGAAIYEHLDVASEDNWARVVAAAVARWGKLDVLVNNAGFMVRGTAETVTMDDWHRAIAVMQTGPLLGMRAAVPAMRLAGGGSIINISSVAGLRGTPNGIAYSAAKFAIRGMSKSAAMDLAGDNITVNSVHPGLILTPFYDRFMPERPEGFGSNMALAGRAGTVDDVTPLVVYLASDESRFCSGAEFVVDSGASAGMWTAR
jgi:3alpha(or 20beta)-hydroxysteroid dehydrogenase